MAERGVGAVTRKRAHQVVSQALRPLVDEGALGRNPFHIVKSPKVPRAKVYVPTSDQLRRLLDHCYDPATKAIVLLAATAMLRIGEIRTLMTGDLDVKRGELLVGSSVSRNPKRKPLRTRSTEPPPRLVQLPKVAVSALRDYLVGREKTKPDLPLFIGARGKQLNHKNFRNRVWIPLLKASGLSQDILFDSLRYAGSAMLLEAGVPAHAVAKRARLADTRMVIERHGALVKPDVDAVVVRTTNQLFQGMLDEPVRKVRRKKR